MARSIPNSITRAALSDANKFNSLLRRAVVSAVGRGPSDPLPSKIRGYEEVAGPQGKRKRDEEEGASEGKTRKAFSWQGLESCVARGTF